MATNLLRLPTGILRTEHNKQMCKLQIFGMSWYFSKIVLMVTPEEGLDGYEELQDSSSGNHKYAY